MILPKGGADMSKQLGEIWKDETSYGGMKWKVQFPKGIMSYKTKEMAKEVVKVFHLIESR